MSTLTYSRSTTVVHRDLPEDVTALRLHRQYSDKVIFRPTWVQEVVEENEDRVTYAVKVGGPTQTKTGKDHASNHAARSWSTRWLRANELAEIPLEIQAILLGPYTIKHLTIDQGAPTP